MVGLLRMFGFPERGGNHEEETFYQRTCGPDFAGGRIRAVGGALELGVFPLQLPLMKDEGEGNFFNWSGWCVNR